jgi:hypothetical protein
MVTERILIPRRALEMAVLALSAVIVPGPSQAFQPARDSVLAVERRQRQAVGYARGLEQCGPRAGSGAPAGAHQSFCREFGPGFALC